MKFICPLIVVEDIRASRLFYEKLLGLKVKFDFGENVTFEGDFSIHESKHFQGLIKGKKIKSGAHNFELYFEEDQLDELESKLKSEGVQFVHQTQEQPWRQKVMRFYDPDEHIIEVGESMKHLVRRLEDEGLDIEGMVLATGLEQAFIMELLNSKQYG